MARQTLAAAAKGFGTYPISAAGGISSANGLLGDLIAAALGVANAAAVPVGITGCNLRIIAATTFYLENDGTTADSTTSMPYSNGDEYIVPKNSRELLLTGIRIVTTGNTELRIALW
jgi:hypothetical protein